MNKRLNAAPIAHDPPKPRDSTALIIRPPESDELVQDAHYDLKNPRSMVRLLPTFIVERVKYLPSRFLEMTEAELQEACFEANRPSDDARLLRIAFWEEYDRCQRYEEKQIDVSRVTQGICSVSYFANRFVTDYRLLAWMLRPPALYLNQLKDIHELSLRQLLAVIQLPIERDEKGKVDTKLIDLQQRIFQHVDMRIKGAIIQKIDQRNLSVNVDVDGNSPEGKKILEQSRTQHLSMSEVESKIKALEEKSIKLQAPTRIETDFMREVSPVVVDIPHSTDEIKK